MTEINLGKIVVIDLENACWEHQPPGEIIEVGVCLLTVPALEISKPRRMFVKPKADSISSFCTKFTGITQDLLNEKGKPLADVTQVLKNEYKIEERVSAGWGDDGHELSTAWGSSLGIPRRYVNICELFSVMVGSPNRVGLDRALEMIKLEFKGVKHTGGDDAFNAACVLRWLMQRTREGLV